MRSRHSRWSDDRFALVLVLDLVAIAFSLTAGIGVGPGPYAQAAKITVLAVAGTLITALTGLAWRGWPRRGDHLRWHADGLARLADGEPEPHVTRWDDVATVSVTFRYEKAGTVQAPHLTRCVLRTTGTPPPADAGAAEIVVDDSYGPEVPLQVAREAGRRLAARLIAPLIRAYDAEATITFGDLGIDLSGITVPATDRRAATFVVPALIGHAAAAHEVRVRRLDRRGRPAPGPVESGGEPAALGPS